MTIVVFSKSGSQVEQAWTRVSKENNGEVNYGIC